MRKHFVIVSIESTEADLTEQLRSRLDKAIDWIELTPSSWLVWTSSSSAVWLRRLKSSSVRFTSAIVIEVNPSDRAGVMPDEVWKFIRKRHPE